ncbi:glycosyltransferase family 2 protein [Pontibacter lucknowensis]|uniref:Glycosyltransferase, GT2 family n=1 Tax=Pontibacter lucknowensis TaxID=1077936 RepID=A0A1N7AZH9_9BACT|nr:glycosyltransferase [Pontibacter lucknowensis]SIR44363.1 Glycosyltransferase, GT2 family [Pontibacter lucknowensis]
MRNHLPYQISHIYLHEGLSLPSLSTHDQGNYLVFWWHDVALGHVFVAPQQSLTETSYHDKLIEAISPAITFYKNQAKMSPTAWKEWVYQKKSLALETRLNNLFSPVSQDAIPDRVPIAAVICTRDRPSQLQNCLSMLLSLPCRPQEIIVVDNAPSNDASAEVVKQFGEVTYIKEPRPGLDIARNTGARDAQASIVAYVDDDVTVHPLWAYQVWKTFQDPGIAAMTGLVIASELKTEAQFIFEKHWSFNRGYTDIFYTPDFIQATLSQGPPVWVIGAGANMAFRKELFEQVGYFDELLDVGAAGCSGDSEMWYRILIKGYTIHYNPRAIAYHEHRREIEGLKKQIFYYMRGHAAAALIQQRQQKAGYIRHLFWRLPKQYAQLLKSGFPNYRYRHKTLFVEMLGVLSGLNYYFKNRQHARQ